MGSKNISVREDVYRTLKREKRADESFSDVIERLPRAAKRTIRCSASSGCWTTTRPRECVTRRRPFETGSTTR